MAKKKQRQAAGSTKKKAAEKPGAPAKKGAVEPLEVETPARTHPLIALRREVDRLVEDFSSRFERFPEHLLDLPRLRGFLDLAPPTDLTEADGEYRMSVELPGMDEKDVEIKVSGDMLTIKGQKKEERETKEKDRYITERRFGSFRRSLRLPDDVDRDEIKATYKKGVLEVSLPKSAEARDRERKIPIG